MGCPNTEFGGPVAFEDDQAIGSKWRALPGGPWADDGTISLQTDLQRDNRA